MKRTFKWGLDSIQTYFHDITIDNGTIKAKRPSDAKGILTKFLKKKYPNRAWKPWDSIKSSSCTVSCYFRITEDENVRIAFWEKKPK